MDYLLMSYIALASCWPVTLILLSVAAVVLLHAERRVLNVSIIVLVGFLVFAAWQFVCLAPCSICYFPVDLFNPLPETGVRNIMKETFKKGGWQIPVNQVA